MDKSYELKYHRLEENHWWFISRRDIILKLIKKLNFIKDTKILDIGCSAGSLLKVLKTEGFTNVCGIDVSKSAVNLCKQKGIKNIWVMDGANTKFKDNEFDLIIASDVLEHIKDDILALSEWYRILKPNGKLIVFVPAFNFLWSSHDEINYHWRRYSKSMLVKKLKKIGYKIEQSSYWNFSLFFPVALISIFQKFFLSKINKNKDRLYKVNPILNRCFITLLKCENWFLNISKFPVGVSIFAICRK